MEQADFVKAFLEKKGIKFREYSHPAVFTVNESHSNPEIRRIPGLRTKSLFLKDDKNNFYLVCLPGEKRLNIKFLKEYFNVKSLEFASSDKLFTELRVKPGSVSLFCLLNSENAILVIDREVIDSPESGFHPNINTETIVLSKEDLIKFVNILKNRKEIIKL